jgi:mannobiose 2-epimerase
MRIALILALVVAQAPGAAPPVVGRDAYLEAAAEVEAALRRDVLEVWFPRCVDQKYGGFRAEFDREWRPGASAGKFSVFQGRMTWVAAQVARRRPELRDRFLPIARHGLDYLAKVMWDGEHGGFFWGLGDDGQISPSFTDGKHLYGMSFCLYGAAAAYETTKDPAALDLAQRAFRWIDAHAHDARYRGYFEWLTRDGKVVRPDHAADGDQLVPTAGFPVGFKSMNTHIHLLESFAELYRVWKDETLRLRLEELLEVVRDRVCVEPGVMSLYFTEDWRAVPGHNSYGHAIETAYLLLEAAEALGRHADPKTERIARMLTDRTLSRGWDDANGGIFREGTTFGPAEDTAKEWWEQMESLNTLLLMHERYRAETTRYFEAFRRQWAFVRDRQIDSQHRGVFEIVARDGTPTSTTKGKIWKAAYHDGRTLLNVAERLRRLAGAVTPDARSQ